MRGQVATALLAAAGVGCGAAVAAFGALVLGEYELGLGLGPLAGLLLGLAVAETVLAVGRSRHPAVAVLAAGSAASGMVWAGWIDASAGIEPVKAGAWVGAVLGGGAAWARIALVGRGRGSSGATARG
jgi:hypothetical protein